MAFFVRWIGCALAFSLALPLAALDPARRANQYLLDSWDAGRGLDAKNVLAIVQTRDGYLWLGTNAGLIRFDGFRFVRFEPANTPEFQAAQVKALLEGSDGSLWIGVYGGGVVRLHDGRFEPFGKAQGLPSLLVRALAEAPQGGVWVGLEGGGAVRLENGAVVERVSQEQGLLRDAVRSLLVSTTGDLWIGTERGGLSRWRHGTLRNWTTNEGLASDTAMSLHEATDGAIWVATTKGLQRLREGSETLQTFGVSDGLPSDSVFTVAGDHDGNLWVGTGGGGLSRFTDGRFSTVSTADGLPNDYVWALGEDRQGGLWVGTEDGLARLRDGLFTMWGERQGLAADQVRGLLEDRAGVLWIAGPKGLNRLENGTATHLGKAQGLPTDYVWSLLEASDGALWLSTDGAGVVRRDGDSMTRFTEREGLGGDMVWSLAEDAHGVIWAATQNGGVSSFADGRWTSVTKRDGLGADVVRAVLVDHSGAVWAGTSGGGVSRIANGTVTPFTTRDGLGSDTIVSLYEDHDRNLWVGSYGGGLSLFVGDRFVTFDRRSGFVTDSIGAMIEDDLGYFWFTGSSVVHRVLQRDLVAQFRGGESRADGLAVTSFTSNDGRRGAAGAGFTPAVWKTREGRLLFASSDGMAMVDPRQIRARPQPSAAIVESLLANHRAVDLDPPPNLPAGTFDLEIHYTAPSLDAPEKTRFRYRLEGYDRDWVEVADRRVAYYPNLPPGSFTFRVAAAGSEGRWVEGASVPLRILPFYYQTLWFKLLLVALGLLALYGLYRLRAGRLEARAAVAEERNRLAREIHDTIAQDLASILMQARVAQRTAAKRSQAPDASLQAIADLAVSSLAEARRSLQALRPPALDGKDLAQALHDIAESATVRHGVPIAVQIEGEGTLAPTVEVELLRIAKEALANALRSSGARRIDIELRTEGGEVQLTVRDDGRGFDPDAALGGFGLIGMRERAETLGGTLAIHSTLGKGTEIVVRSPRGGRES